MVYEARGDNKQAADYYRQAIAFIREHPDQQTSRRYPHPDRPQGPHRIVPLPEALVVPAFYRREAEAEIQPIAIAVDKSGPRFGQLRRLPLPFRHTLQRVGSGTGTNLYFYGTFRPNLSAERGHYLKDYPTYIGMPADLFRSPNQASRYGEPSRAEESPLARLSEGPSAYFWHFRPRFVRLAEFRLLGLLVPVIASSKL
jgi:hypothetical protein